MVPSRVLSGMVHALRPRCLARRHPSVPANSTAPQSRFRAQLHRWIITRMTMQEVYWENARVCNPSSPLLEVIPAPLDPWIPTCVFPASMSRARCQSLAWTQTFWHRGPLGRMPHLHRGSPVRLVPWRLHQRDPASGATSPFLPNPSPLNPPCLPSESPKGLYPLFPLQRIHSNQF